MKKATAKSSGRKSASRPTKRAAGPSSSTAKAGTVQRLIAMGAKKYGEDVFNTFSKGSGCEIRKRYSTGVAVLDVALTRKVGEGFPGGRITEVLGEEHCGKTTLCLCTLARAQQDGFALLNDTESTTTEKRLTALGVDAASLVYPELEYIEDVLNMFIDVARKSAKTSGVMLLDSIAGCMSRHEAGREVGEQAIGRHALALSQGLRKLAQILKRTPVAVVFINQRKEGGIGNIYATERQKDATLGGKALKFHAQVRLRLLFKAKVGFKIGGKGSAVYTGDLIKATVIKDKERGSGTKACEVLLFLRKIGDGRGQFDNALSCWYTLHGWKINGASKGDSGDERSTATAPLIINGKKYTMDAWCTAYNTSSSFRTAVHALLEEASERLDEYGVARKAKPEKEKRKRTASDDEEEDMS